MMIDSEFLAILVCPVCKGKLIHDPERRVLICRAERLAYPISEEGIPILLAEKAEPLPADEG